MTDAILRDAPASTQSEISPNFLSRARNVLQSLKAICLPAKAPDLSISLETPLPKISSELIQKIIDAHKLKENDLVGPSYKAKLHHDIDRELRLEISPDLLREHDELEEVIAHADANPNWAAAGRLRLAKGYLRDELGRAFDTVKGQNKALGWGLSDLIHKVPVTQEDKLHRLAIDLSLMEAYSTAARCYNHVRNEGAEYRRNYLPGTVAGAAPAPAA